MIYLIIIASYIALRCYWNHLENMQIMQNQIKIAENQNKILKLIK